jgi:hypothetical protein
MWRFLVLDRRVLERFARDFFARERLDLDLECRKP